MQVLLQSSVLSGNIEAIASKSDVHRLLFCAALADAPTDIRMPGTTELSDDIQATMSCIQELGALVKWDGEYLRVAPAQKPADHPAFNCRESGSTLRFLLPIAAAVCQSPSFSGEGRLPERPIIELLQAMEQNGISCSAEKLPFTFSGSLKPGTYSLPGNVSSQYITGLLFALPLLPGDSSIVLTSELQSASYIDITIHALRRFGIRPRRTRSGWDVPGNQIYHSPGELTADGDWSNAAYFLAAGAIGEKPVTVTNLNEKSPQGDKAIVPVLRKFGAEVQVEGNSVTVFPSRLRGTTVDLSDIPDSLPVLAVVAAFAEGKSTFTGAARLRLKESDRIRSVADMITALGGSVREQLDGLIVSGRNAAPLTGGDVSSCNDHRIVMAAAIAAANAPQESTIDGAEAVRKSYPTFFSDYNRLGGLSHGI